MAKSETAIVVRSWQVQDGGWRAQVRQEIPGRSSGRCPLHEVQISYRPRDGSRVMIRNSPTEGWRIAD